MVHVVLPLSSQCGEVLYRGAWFGGALGPQRIDGLWRPVVPTVVMQLEYVHEATPQQIHHRCSLPSHVYIPAHTSYIYLVHMYSSACKAGRRLAQVLQAACSTCPLSRRPRCLAVSCGQVRAASGHRLPPAADWCGRAALQLLRSWYTHFAE